MVARGMRDHARRAARPRPAANGVHRPAELERADLLEVLALEEDRCRRTGHRASARSSPACGGPRARSARPPARMSSTTDRGIAARCIRQVDRRWLSAIASAPSAFIEINKCDLRACSSSAGGRRRRARSGGSGGSSRSASSRAIACVERHRALVAVEPVAVRDRLVLGFLGADDQHGRDLLELRVADLGADLLGPEVDAWRGSPARAARSSTLLARSRRPCRRSAARAPARGPARAETRRRSARSGCP